MDFSNNDALKRFELKKIELEVKIYMLYRI
jgi:hypothetical protein